jgi:two-component system nitrate/nitrite response regulator NarL
LSVETGGLVQSKSSQLPGVVARSREVGPSMFSNPDRGINGVKLKPATASGFRVLIIDRDSMTSDLLASTLTRERNCRASAVSSANLLRSLESERAEIVVIGAELNESQTGFDLAQMVSRTYPSVLIVMLLNQSTHESVVNAFRSGARGVFSRQQPAAEFLDCVEHVRKGFIWAGAEETTLLLDAFRCIPSPNVAVANEASALTERELQVVQCAAKGMTNKVIASELGLSEHTVKNYLFRSFEKIGVSNRVELLFYLTMRGHPLGAARARGPEPDLKAG